MNETFLFFAMLLMSALFSLACVTGATEAEIEAACANLERLRTGEPADEAEARRNKCKQDLARERLSKAAAQCRSKATDLDTFWNKCR